MAHRSEREIGSVRQWRWVVIICPELSWERKPVVSWILFSCNALNALWVKRRDSPTNIISEVGLLGKQPDYKFRWQILACALNGRVWFWYGTRIWLFIAWRKDHFHHLRTEIKLRNTTAPRWVLFNCDRFPGHSNLWYLLKWSNEFQMKYLASIVELEANGNELKVHLSISWSY